LSVDIRVIIIYFEYVSLWLQDGYSISLLHLPLALGKH